MHSKLLKRTKWGIGRAICDSKRTALLDGIWFLGRRLFIASDSNTWSGDPSIHKRHFLAFLIGLRLAWLALMTSFLLLFHVLKSTCGPLSCCLGSTPATQIFNFYHLFSYTYPYRFELIAFVCGHLPWCC